MDFQMYLFRQCLLLNNPGMRKKSHSIRKTDEKMYLFRW